MGTACQVTLTASIEAGPDGAGFVRAGIGMDNEALAQLGDPATELRLDDLRAAGWTVTGPVRERDGLTWVRIAHRFTSPAEATRLAAQLGEPFQGLRLVRRRSFLKTKTRLTGSIDLSKGLAAFSDPALQAALGGADLGALTDDNVHLRFEARLQGQTRTWSPKLGEQVDIAAQAQSWNTGPVAAAIAAVAAVAAVAFALTGLVAVFAARRR